MLTCPEHSASLGDIKWEKNGLPFLWSGEALVELSLEAKKKKSDKL